MEQDVSQKLEQLGKSIGFLNETVQTVIEMIPHGIVIVNPSGEFIIWNEHAKQLIGTHNGSRNIEHFIDEMVFTNHDFETDAVIPADDLPISHALAGQSVTRKITCRWPNGNYIILNVEAFPINNGAVVLFKEATDVR
jgi:sensor histidine kinase regulating citrate/malate metabolism